MTTHYDFNRDGKTLMGITVKADRTALLYDGFAVYPIDRGMAAGYLRGWRWLARGGSRYSGVTLERYR